LTTKGDIWGFSSLDVAVPTGGITKDGYVLTADSTATAGVSYQPWAYASKSLIGQTTGSGPFNLQHASAVLPAGLYRVICYVSINGTGAGLAVQVSYTWTDERGNSFAPAPTVITGVPPTPMWGNAPIDVHTDGVTNLTVNFGNAGTGTFDVYVVVIRLL
jgi:hypothetical protein